MQKTETKSIQQLWIENKIDYCEMEFDCGGDQMNDTSFSFYDEKGNELTNIPDAIETYLDGEVYNNVEFYVNSDGEYIGEYGSVRIKLNTDDEDEEPSFTYEKSATEMWSEWANADTFIELTDEERKIIQEKISNMNGDAWNDTNVNYKTDCIITDAEEEVLKTLMEKIKQEAENYEFDGQEGEADEETRWKTNDDGDNEIEFDADGSLKIEVERYYRIERVGSF